MSNMSYCKFENTLQDLRDCLYTLREARSWKELEEDASEYERDAMRGMKSVLEEMVEHFDNLDEDELDNQ